MQQRLEFAKQIALEAGKFTLPFFRDASIVVEQKADMTPVTAADRGAELLLRKRIEEMFPDDAILGEEFPEKRGGSGWQWILDPIDGTKSFIHGVPLYSTLVGVRHGDESLIGVIELPALGERVWAAKSVGAWREGKYFDKPVRAEVSKTKSFGEALLLTSEIRTFQKQKCSNVFDALEAEAGLTRTWGDAYGYALVATGRADVMVDPALSIWDAGPLLIIMQESGGCFSGWNGKQSIEVANAIAANSILHAETLKICQLSSQ
ncbi:MAG: histidinol-phosphatase [Planctomycetaceae bacterium]|jgi:histidinol phosphatase-like enzyme (inositol monophosphatase family)|nr:histidinol-phosphatase [Planctomycetaceae bacterium]